MADSDVARRLGVALVATAGGYLRNPVRREWTTCAVCTTPASGYQVCLSCHWHQAHGGRAERVAALTYAVGGSQSGYVMRGYKARPRIEEHHRVVAMLALLGMHGHGVCAAVLARMPVTHWAAVPSLPAKPGEHPFRQIVKASAPGDEVPLRVAGSVVDPRTVGAGHFSVDGRLPGHSHVLLMDDTWVKGGHAQSAALALRAAGARQVSVLVVARWVNERYRENAEFLRNLPDYDPAICPWTGGGCPDGVV